MRIEAVRSAHLYSTFRQRTIGKTLAVAFCLIGFQQMARGGQFLPAVNYPVGSNPFAVAVGDFNNDGIPDLAVANYAYSASNSTISILIGNGDGTFKAAVNYSSGGAEPDSVAVGDFNADGRLDLAVGNYAGGGGGVHNISVLLGNGDGTFSAPIICTADIRPRSVAVGDFNSDGRLDLAVANDSNDTATVLLGNGDGTFQAAANYPTGFAPSSVVVADFNQDGKLDLAVANENADNVSILLGRGDGTFHTAMNYAAGMGPASVASGDFNGDGKLDLVVANAASSFGTIVSVLLGNGDGTFQAPASYPGGEEPFSVAVGDFNKDEKLDVAVADASGDGISLLLGNGDGTFQVPVEYNVDASPVSVTAADLNGDGLLDLAVANLDSNNVSVLLNTFPSCTTRPDITDVRADPDELWPSDHRFVKVLIRYHATSSCGTPACKLTVTSNDRDDDKDWFVLDAHHVDLRPEVPRHSDRNRVYRIAIKCTDQSGNSARAHTIVTVGDDRGDRGH